MAAYGGRNMHNRYFKGILRYIALFCVVAMLASFVSCNDNSKESDTLTEKYYTVSFNSNGGSTVESIKVIENKYAKCPDDPTLDNYVFSHWELDGRRWVFETKKVTENVTLSAIWISAVELFELEPDEASGGLVITGFKKQADFRTLNIPSMINGKTVVGIADGAMKYTHAEHAENIIIPNTVVSLGKEAFSESAEVNLDIRGTVSTIGEACFKSCRLLETLKLGEGMESIPFMAFFDCASLKTMNVPNGVKTIEENAFEGCSAMKTIVLPATLTSIQDSGFMGCSSLKSIFFCGTEEQFDAIEIADSNEPIIDANVYFYCETEPSEDGAFWHYENGSPIIWQ